MNDFGVEFLGHNIPQVMRADCSTILAFRVQNTLDRNLYFQSHASFYGPPINDSRYHLFIRLNGVFVKHVLVHNDCLPAKKRATLYFPFQTGDEREYRLQIVMSEHPVNAIPNEEVVLFEMSLQVTKDRLGFAPWQKIQQSLFTFLHTEIPIQFKKLQLHFSKRKLDVCPRKSDRRKRALGQYKEINRELAFLEKQVRKTQVASLPCYLGIDTTSKCNLNCRMCYRNYVDVDYNAKPDMPVEMVDRLIKDLFPSALTLNLSTVGEPLMSPYMKKILDACSDYQVYLSITTNGTLFRGDDFIKKLASVLHYIEISFDSPYPQHFEAFRVGASYKKVLQNAAKLGAIRRALPEPKFNLGFSMTLFRDNLEEIPEVLRIISEIGGNFLKTDIGVIFSKEDLPQSVVTCPELYNEAYRIAHEKAQEIGIRLLMRPPFGEHEQIKAVKDGLCDFLYLTACVRSEGTLSPCYFGPALLPVKNQFKAAWNSEIMQQLRLDHDTTRAHPLCRDCYIFLDGTDSVENRKKQFLKGDAFEGFPDTSEDCAAKIDRLAKTY